MKTLATSLIILAIIVSTGFSQEKSFEEYVDEAKKYEQSGNLDQAISVMEEVVKKHPANSDAYTFLGHLIGKKLRKTNDMLVMIRIGNKTFELWDKAVSLDPQNVTARFYRGSWGVSLPEFFSRLETGIKDLEFLIRMNEQSPDKPLKGKIIGVYDLLGLGYRKKGKFDQAETVWKKVIEIAPGTEYAAKAEKKIKDLSFFEKIQSQIKKLKPEESIEIKRLKERIALKPDSPDLLLKLGKAYFKIGSLRDAADILKKVTTIDPSHLEAHKLLVFSLHKLANKEYDENIYYNTDFRTNLSFELIRALDNAVAHAPEDIELRLTRGIAGVQMPFFVDKLEQSINDLIWVGKSDADDATKAEALYWLGATYQKKSMTSWIEVVSNYSNTDAASLVFDDLNPEVKHIDCKEYQKPILCIDFILGFKDELAPQTAVWIENNDGNFVKTIYVSGFSGYVKDEQIQLGDWADASEFIDVDGVTGASIDLGHHIHIWDLTNYSGEKVRPGKYKVKVETHYWPSYEYQLVTAAVELGESEERKVIEEGNLIPYLEITYYPD